jgi:hypothetical protein
MTSERGKLRQADARSPDTDARKSRLPETIASLDAAHLFEPRPGTVTVRKHPFLLLLLLGACFCADSQTLHQCSGRSGTTAYRSGACLAGERLVAVRDIEVEIAPDPVSQDAPVRVGSHGRSRRATQPGRVRPARATRRSSRSSRNKSTVDPCTREKRARDGFQRRRGIKVTMAELSRWNHRVYDACK